MTDETTTEQLAEIEGQAEDTPVTEYTPPEGWRVLAVGEVLRDGDVWVNHEGESRPTKRVGETVNDERYIRPIEPKAEPEPEPPDGWQLVPLGEPLKGGDEYHAGLDRYIRPIEPKPQPEPQPEPEPQAATIEELRSEVSYVQRLLGESRQRVTQFEELVVSLRTINRGCENAVRDAGKENTDLQHRLNVVAAEWAEQAETTRRLQIELDAAQQVPQAIADRFEEGWNQGTARAIETVLEWLEPIRLADSAYLANATMQHLPSIMRHLTGLAQD